MQIPEHLKKAVDNYLAGIATPLEKQQVNDWFRSFNDDEVEIPSEVPDQWLKLREDMRAGIEASIQRQEPLAKPARVRLLSVYRWVAAAGIALLVCGSYFYFSQRSPSVDAAKISGNTHLQLNDVPPGGSKAVLTLADGSTIVLDSAKNGTLIRQGTVDISKPEDGQLAYNTGAPGAKEVLYNIIATPRGGEYALQLADGSKVWINAASSLRFPTAFNGDERRVELTGEAYFEVAGDPGKPFKVIVNGIEVAVLGTHFNINAYTDESSIRTTLVEGAVKVTGEHQSLLLSPGQQAQVDKAGEMTLIKKANLDVATAWKNGRFEFEDNSITSVMQQIQRWYNVAVVYDGKIPDIRFSGAISRQENVSKVLSMLELTHLVRFRMENNTIHIIP
ncbi:FecR domain-containing protein [Chitinophaga defluvii]|uniref:FecR domain-containing protein n=1 Tax=Chitinophaga defluvii TaxID=3163343 RepID=A0ABV2T2I5_9BACT